MQKNKRIQLHKSTRLRIPYALITYALMLAPLVVGVLLPTGLTGCAKQQQFKAVEQICVPTAAKAEAMQAAKDVLGKMHFTIDKADAEQGLVRTRPLTGAQFFEFWRSDSVGAFNSTEANLHSIRRVAELNISPRDLPGGKPGSGGQLCIGCNVKVSRLSLPEQQISSSARAYQMFSQSSPSMQRLELYPEQKKGMAWVVLGNDTMLATEILKRLKKQMNRE